LERAHHPIGIFDSGIGGLTVANAVSRLMPNERLIYFGDTAHMPYGDKSADAIRYYSLRIAKFLLEQQCKLIIVACNSASSAAYEVLLAFFDQRVLFVNVVDPLVEKIASTSYRHIGVIATKTTINAGIYTARLRDRIPDVQVQSLATPLLAPMIEEGFGRDAISKSVLDTYLGDEKLAGIDALLLACTHYPLIRPEIEAWYGGQVAVFDSTDVVALAAQKRLREAALISSDKSSDHHFYVSDYTPSFEETARLFYGREVRLEHHGLWS
jgi:glutamate racemase